LIAEWGKREEEVAMDDDVGIIKDPSACPKHRTAIREIQRCHLAGEDVSRELRALLREALFECPDCKLTLTFIMGEDPPSN
jgi:hypothetical protein